MTTMNVVHALDRIDMALSSAGFRPDSIFREELHEARNVMIELFEADEAYDVARSRYDYAFSQGSLGDMNDQWEAQKMLREARGRRAAALARFGADA